MGRDVSSAFCTIVYGVKIKIPKEPRWDVMEERLKNFDYDRSLFATAARAVSKADLDREDIPDQITKSAKLAVLPVLVSDCDYNSSDDDDEDDDKDDDKDDDDDEDYENTDWLKDKAPSIEKTATSAMEKILGTADHGLRLILHVAVSGIEDYGGPIPPLLLLSAKECFRTFRWEAHAESHDLTFAEFSDQEKKDAKAKIDQVLKAFGLEAQGDIGWKISYANSLHPD